MAHPMVQAIEKSPPGGNLSDHAASQIEEEFVAGLRAMQEWAYRKLVVDYSDRLFRIAYRFLRNAEEAQDILQEVYRKVLEKIQTFKGDSKLSTWLYRVTVNESLMKVRSSRADPKISWEEILPQYEDGIYLQESSDWNKLPETKLIEKEALSYLRQCTQDLPADYCAPYLLKDVEQLSENEVCEILGLEKPVMKIRAHRARMFLRKKLEEKYVR